MRRHTLVLPLVLPLAGCLLPALPRPMTQEQVVQNQQQAMAQAWAQQDAVLVQQLAQLRAQAQANPDSALHLERWGGTLESLWQTGTVQRGALDGAAELQQVRAAIAQAPVSQAERGRLLAVQGRIELAAGRTQEAEATLQKAIKAHPTTLAAVPLARLLAGSGRAAEVVPLCRTTRPALQEEDEIVLLLEACAEHSGAPLSTWASAKDQALYAREQQQAADRAAQREEERRAQTARMQADWARERQQSDARRAAQQRSGETSSGGATSVTLRSQCGRTVPVFYGETPRFGSGTQSSVSSNSVQSVALHGGALTIWITDAAGNGLSSVRVTSNTREVTIDPSCRSLSAR